MKSNIYYNPEDYGLLQITERDTGGSYEFNKVVVWKHKNGLFYYATDAGCSCPTPFEDTEWVDLQQLDPHNDMSWLGFVSSIPRGDTIPRGDSFYDFVRGVAAKVGRTRL